MPISISHFDALLSSRSLLSYVVQITIWINLCWEKVGSNWRLF